MEIKVHHAGTPVALVKIPETMDVEQALEYAWRWTNNVAGSWSQGPEIAWDGVLEDNGDYNPNVTRLVPLHIHNGRTYGLRSSMVGDVFEVVGGDQYVVANFGFEKV